MSTRCQQCRDRIWSAATNAAERPVLPGDVAEHVAECSACAEELLAAERIHAALATLPALVPSSRLRTRLRSVPRSERWRRQAALVAMPAAAGLCLAVSSVVWLAAPRTQPDQRTQGASATVPAPTALPGLSAVRGPHNGTATGVPPAPTALAWLPPDHRPVAGASALADAVGPTMARQPRDPHDGAAVATQRPGTESTGPKPATALHPTPGTPVPTSVPEQMPTPEVVSTAAPTDSGFGPPPPSAPTATIGSDRGPAPPTQWPGSPPVPSLVPTGGAERPTEAPPTSAATGTALADPPPSTTAAVRPPVAETPTMAATAAPSSSVTVEPTASPTATPTAAPTIGSVARRRAGLHGPPHWWSAHLRAFVGS